MSCGGILKEAPPHNYCMSALILAGYAWLILYRRWADELHLGGVKLVEQVVKTARLWVLSKAPH